jgi:DeoR/GlpR family transcriptional regulator of sugar metabolism
MSEDKKALTTLDKNKKAINVNKDDKPGIKVTETEVEPTTPVRIMPRGLYIRRKISDQTEEKRKIAIYIAEKYIKDFNAVLLDAGSTAEMVAEEMFARRSFLSVLTNNMGAYASYTRARSDRDREPLENEAKEISEYYARGNELLITGGIYVDTYEALLGEVTLKSIDGFTPNITIIGVSGLRMEEGVFCHGADERAVKSLLWTKKTDIRLIATDWSKIGRRDAHPFGILEQLRVNASEGIVVTCKYPDGIDDDRKKDFDDQIKYMKDAGIKVHTI